MQQTERPVCWVGIDPSYSGYAIVALHGDDTCDAQRLSFAPKDAGTGAKRLDIIYRTLQRTFRPIAQDFDVQVVAVEGYAMNSKWGREKAGELGAVTRIVSLRVLKREPLIVAPTSLKKFVTGVGAASKDDMKAKVAEKWGEFFKSHDIADAYGLARIAKAAVHGATVDHEREVMTVLKARNAL